MFRLLCSGGCLALSLECKGDCTFLFCSGDSTSSDESEDSSSDEAEADFTGFLLREGGDPEGLRFLLC